MLQALFCLDHGQENAFIFFRCIARLSVFLFLPKGAFATVGTNASLAARPMVRSNTLTEHALHGKGLQKQIGAFTLVSSRERRALFVPRINWIGTTNQLRVCISVPGHALHEKGLRRQIGVGTLVSIQERSLLLGLLINWL